MDRDKIRALGARIPAGPVRALWQFLRWQWDEVTLVRTGAAGTVVVLGDEIACV
ncbi:hypothetical protein [Gemmata sp.]|uniref:hypothetical protein n=1 Tax=Gemmata sp. TaxID=1914242 RepID=UPI003F713021